MYFQLEVYYYFNKANKNKYKNVQLITSTKNFLRWYQGKSKFFFKKKSLFISTILVYKIVIENHSQKIEFVKKKIMTPLIMRIINDILAKNIPYFLTKISL